MSRGSDRPASIGRFEVVEKIASGGMADVYLARQSGPLGVERPVAIKRIRPELVEDAHYRDMFLDEARVAAAIRSPHVVPTYELGYDDRDAPYIAMEWVDGASLRDLLRREGSPLPITVAATILIHAARGLHDAHEASRDGEPLGVVHRDVCPNNMLVGRDGCTRIMDFGIAWAAQRLVADTRAGTVKGKLSYFSPEQARDLALDRRSDVFSLGVVAWELFAGRRLFARRDMRSLLQALLFDTVPRLDTMNRHIPSSVADVVERALNRDRGSRTPSARDFAEELQAAFPAVADELEVGAYVDRVLARGDAEAPAASHWDVVTKTERQATSAPEDTRPDVRPKGLGLRPDRRNDGGNPRGPTCATRSSIAMSSRTMSSRTVSSRTMSFAPVAGSREHAQPPLLAWMAALGWGVMLLFGATLVALT